MRKKHKIIYSKSPGANSRFFADYERKLTERRPAAAGRGGVRVLILKAALFEGVDVVDLDALEEGHAFLIDNDAKSVLLGSFVIVVRILLELHFVGKTRAAAGDDTDA